MSAQGTPWALWTRGLNFGRPLDTDWMENAVCGEHDPELFFPNRIPRGMRYAPERQQAISICGTCPVSRECLAYALRGSMQDGIFGGIDEQQRKVLHTKYLRRYGDTTNGQGRFFESLLNEGASVRRRNVRSLFKKKGH